MKVINVELIIEERSHRDKLAYRNYDTKAIVTLRPNLLARIFGAKDLKCMIIREKASTWISELTDRALHTIPYGNKILHALEFHNHNIVEIPYMKATIVNK